MEKEAARQGESYVFEGMTSISAVINGGRRKIEKVLIDKEKADARRRETAFLKRSTEKLGFEIEYTDDETINSLCTGHSHGGIIAVCSAWQPDDLCNMPASLLDRTAADGDTRKNGGFFVMIDGIEDPYNFGYALRTLYAAGADAAILTPRNWMSAAGVVCRASAGASELLPMFVSEPEDACRFFKSHGVRCVAAGIRNSVSAFDADLSLPLFLIVGGEKRGISAKTLELADSIVRLDYGREFRASLSAASAASVIAYEIFRQNRKNKG